MGLEEVSRKTKLQIRDILARRFPQADIPANLRKLPAIDPLAPGRYRLLLTLNAEQKEKLELARDLLSHANSDGDLAVVIERALDKLIEQLEKRRFGRAQPRPKISETKVSESKASAPDAETQSGLEPKTAESTPRRRKHIARAVRRELVARAGGRCTFVGCDGTRCDARAFLQLHHRQAWARGGDDTEDNLTLLCYAHNRLLAEQDFGQAHIDHAVARRKADRSTHDR